MLTICFQMLSAAFLLEYSMAPKSMDYLFIPSSIVSQQKPSASRRLFQHIFIYTNIQLFIQQIKKYLLCAKNCAKFWEHNGEQNKLGPSSYEACSVTEETHINQWKK